MYNLHFCLKHKQRLKKIPCNFCKQEIPRQTNVKCFEQEIVSNIEGLFQCSLQLPFIPIFFLHLHTYFLFVQVCIMSELHNARLFIQVSIQKHIYYTVHTFTNIVCIANCLGSRYIATENNVVCRLQLLYFELGLFHIMEKKFWAVITNYFVARVIFMNIILFGQSASQIRGSNSIFCHF